MLVLCCEQKTHIHLYLPRWASLVGPAACSLAGWLIGAGWQEGVWQGLSGSSGLALELVSLWGGGLGSLAGGDGTGGSPFWVGCVIKHVRQNVILKNNNIA